MDDGAAVHPLSCGPRPSWHVDPALKDLKAMLGMSMLQLARYPLIRDLPVPEVHCFEEAAYLDYRTAGISIICEAAGVAAVQLHAPGHEGFHGWTRALPAALRFDMDRQLVRAALSKPDATCDGQFVAGLGWKPPWDLFLTAAAQVHVEYRPKLRAGFQMVTIEAPRRDAF